jgi:hypothetical protein
VALVTSTFVQTSFPLFSGNVVQKIKKAQIVPSLVLAMSPIKGRIGVRKGAPPPAGSLVTSSIVGQHYTKYWREKTHIITGDTDVGLSENRTFAIGNVLTPQIRKFTVYNAREITPINITSIVLANGEGITLDDPVQPDFLNNKTTKLYTFTVDIEGPPVINATFTVVTDQGETYVLTVLGSRVTIMPFEPQVPMVQRLEYHTWIRSNEDGSEQRQGFRNLGIEKWSYRFRFRELLAARLENFLFVSANSQLGLPLWYGHTTLAAEATAGLLAFTTADDPSVRGFREGGGNALALLIQDDQTFEAVGVNTIIGNAFTTTQALLATWPAGTLVLPLRLSQMDQLEQSTFRVNARDLSVSFEILSNEENPDISSFATYLSLPVFEDPQLLVSGNMARAFDLGLKKFDPVTAPTFQLSNRLTPSMAFGFGHKMSTLVQYDRLWQFFQDRHGMRQPWWLPTQREDFFISEDTIAGTDLRVQNALFARMFLLLDGSERRTHMRIEYVDGGIDYRLITAITEISDIREDITLSAASSQALSAANVFKMSWLLKVRFASDELEFSHNHAGDITVPISVIDVEG